MSTVTTVPVSIHADAETHVAKLGMRREFEQMVVHIRQSVPGLDRIEITLFIPYEGEDEPRVTFDAIRRSSEDLQTPIFNEWCTWVFTEFSPDVIRHFTFFSWVENDDGR